MAFHEDDEFHQFSYKKRNTRKRHVSIGNLPLGSPKLTSQLLALFESMDVALPPDALSIEDDSRSCRAVIECSATQADALLTRLPLASFEGRRLTVQRLTRSRDQQPNTRKFASSSWTRPRAAPSTNQQTSGEESFSGDTKDQCPACPREETVARQEPMFGQQSLADLLADLGEQDVNWKTAFVQEAPATAPARPSHDDSVLGLHGKAPIHVLLTTFGYHHGAPPHHGWSHARPLNAFDVRQIVEPVPQYMAWQHGLSATVKHTLFRQDKDGRIKTTANDIANQIATALEAAINESGHGYSSPLHVAVFIGSENGQHRSVVVAEQATTALRKLLRENLDRRFGTNVRVSVGTEHRDLERRAKDSAAKPKQNDIEDEW